MDDLSGNLKQLRETPLREFDWRVPPKGEPLDNSQKQLLNTVVQDVRSRPIASLKLEPDDIEILYRAGTYLMHRHKQAENATQLLQAAQHQLDRPEHNTLRGEWMQNGEYLPLGNNLAYAIINTPQVAVESLGDAQTYLDKSIKYGDVETRAFAQRVQGQKSFVLAERASSFDKRVELVRDGAKQCLEGVEGLEPATNPKHLTEVARTHNRNAVEWMKAVSAADKKLDKIMSLQTAFREANTALELWQTYDKDENFAGYKGLTHRTLGDIEKARLVVEGVQDSLGKAIQHYSQAVACLDKAGNIKDRDICAGALAALLSPQKDQAI